MVHLRIDEPSASSALEHLACDGPSCGGSHVHREDDLVRTELLHDSACGGMPWPPSSHDLLNDPAKTLRRTPVH